MDAGYTSLARAPMILLLMVPGIEVGDTEPAPTRSSSVVADIEEVEVARKSSVVQQRAGKVASFRGFSVGICFVIRMTGALELTREEEHGGNIENKD